MKRNANGNGSVRKISVARDGKTYTYWQARYSAGFDPGTGKQKQHSITGKTQKEVLQKLKAAGFRLPVLRHAQSFVSPSAVLAPGSVVLAMACVGTGSVVEEGAILNLGAILDHDCTLGACAHLAPGSVVKAGNCVPPQAKIDSGCVLARAAVPGKGNGVHV